MTGSERVRGSVGSLVVYPIKGCGGVPLDAAEIARHGFALDRRWMLVDPEGIFVSQRSRPRLALVRVAVGEGVLRVSAPAMPELELPLTLEGGERIPAEVWSDVCDAVAVGAEADGWFSEFLGSPVRLVHLPDDALRTVDQEFAEPSDRVGFADGFPFLLTSTASLGDLNRRAGTDLPMDRFRPNIVVSGFGAFAEDGWQRVRIGEVAFRVAKPCARCAVTTVDQRTAVVGKEPLATLATFRKVRNKVMFGQNLVQDGFGTIRVGDQVEVLA